MSRLKPIQVFEHSLLRKSSQPGYDLISDAQWQALGDYNKLHKNRFFTVQTDGIRFSQYVGVIQVGNQTIEILPKIDRQEDKDQKGLWQEVLINMLRECHWLDQHAHQQAPLRIRHRSILEAYLELFLNHCEAILHQGLVKRYRQENGNKFALKGKLLFAQNIRVNAFHAERFYTRHTVYDSQHLLNQILYKAIKLVPKLSSVSSLTDKVSRLLLGFPELPDIAVSSQTFQSITYNRKTAHYEEAINIAAMLLLHYRPDVRGGSQHVLAVLFDMNDLWEEYVYRQMKKIRSHRVQPQRQKVFWRPNLGTGHKVIRPDIVVSHTDGASRQVTTIVDTKWKQPDKKKPGDDDLKQMFAYNEFWEAGHAVLIYPEKEYKPEPTCHRGHFKKKTSEEELHGCSMVWISVLNPEHNGLDKDMGVRLLRFLDRLYKTPAPPESLT